MTTRRVGLTLFLLVVTALAVAAAVMLFRSDARAWFGEDAAEEPVPYEPLP